MRINLTIQTTWLGVILVLWAIGAPAADLDAVQRWLRSHPADGTNAPERRERMALIQQAADRLSPQQWRTYKEAWTANPAVADRMEEEEPILHYLSGSTAAAIADIRQTKVERGVVVWHLYNMGYVFKTPQGCFGIDLSFRRAPQLADDLDFLLVTHEHLDHRYDPLLEAMTAKQKPVVSSFYKPGKRIPVGNGAPTPVELHINSFRIKIDIGDHHHDWKPPQLNNMLMYQVDCGDCTIYHTGDGGNKEKLKPDRPVGIFIPHVSVGLPIEQTIRQINPKITLLSHVLELGHSPKPPNAWRWSFEYAFGTVKHLPQSRATVLTWGERWEWPGTISKAAGS